MELILVQVDMFLSATNTRLHASYELVVARLNKWRVRASALISNVFIAWQVPFIESKAGFFVWCDFSRFLSAPTQDSEMAFWLQLVDAGVFSAATIIFPLVARGVRGARGGVPLAGAGMDAGDVCRPAAHPHTGPRSHGTLHRRPRMEG